MFRNSRCNFNPEFRLEAAELVIDQHYTVTTVVATAMNVGKSTMDK